MPKSSDPLSFTANESPGLTSISAALPTTTKKPKFKPSIPSSASYAQGSSIRKPGLTVFRTPGFQASVTQSTSLLPPSRDVVYVSSDSSPSTPGQVKRDSSGFLVLDAPPAHPPKRQKVVTPEDKENILGNSSKINRIAPQNPSSSPARKNSDITSASLETLNKYRVYSLDIRNYVMEECLAFHSGQNMEKDPILLEQLKQVIDARHQAIELAKKNFECRTKAQSLSEPEKPLTPIQTSNGSTTGHAMMLNVQGSVEHPPNSVPVPVTSISGKGTASSVVVVDDDGSDDGYWDGMEDITMHDVTLESAPSTSFLAPTALATTDCTKNSGKGSLVSSPYYCEIVDKLRNVFRLTEFRPNQLEAITAALGGRDVFVLMPTGGGKSLCFQLPGVCASGKTQGVTVVVSPLLALMKDQVDSLIKKQVNALLSNAETVGEDWQLLVRNERKPKLWYVTPEKLRDSPKVNEILSILYREKKLARFVIDEAHCISTWGQDFRDAYTSLGSLREKYPSVPIMALTATANKRTVKDIVTQLKLKDQASFSQSFNRPNLKYLVQRKKPDSPIIEIVEFIQTKHRGEGGVIYCNTRAKCESVAEVLRSKGLSAAHFHAGMSTQEKDHTVCSWQNGTTLIIVATIAFGMGIDKPDVRFVIHHDMPKSMSGYYQETGRAGRDGKPADCLMFFSGVDLKRLIFQIQNGDDTTPESVQRQINAAREVIQFAENTSECRRVQILRHFDEKFAKAECARGCDTCEDGRETVSKDVTEYAQVALRLVQFLNSRKENITLQQLKGILRGANTVEIRAKQHDKLPQYAYCESLPKELIELMLNRLLSFDMLMNVPVKNRSGFHNDYLELGSNAQAILENDQDMVLDWHPKPERQTKNSKRTKLTIPGSESVSAPPAPSHKGKKKAIIEDDPIEASDNMYEWDDNSHSHAVAQLSSGPSHIIAPTKAWTTPHSKASNGAKVSTRTEMNEQDLYQRMLLLRNEISRKSNVENDEVFEDTALQWLSLTCPSDYHSFKQELANSMELHNTEDDNYINKKWDKYGQQFLEICIHHKAMTQRLNVTHPPAAMSLHAIYDYQPPSAASSNTATVPASSRKAKSKFKPALSS